MIGMMVASLQSSYLHVRSTSYCFSVKELLRANNSEVPNSNYAPQNSVDAPAAIMLVPISVMRVITTSADAPAAIIIV